MGRAFRPLVVVASLIAAPVVAQETFEVALQSLADSKAVFATVESSSVVAARARIGGTLAELGVGEGERVEAGAEIGRVVDDKLLLSRAVLDAQIAALEAQVAQLTDDLARARELAARGTVATVRVDELRTALDVARNTLAAREAELAVLEQQAVEGVVLAPAAGRVLAVPVTPGTVLMPGETVATIADEDVVLRLRLPERHARFLGVGDPVRLAGGELGTAAAEGTIRLVYPRIEDGRVVADAEVPGLGDYFVGERIRVLVAAGTRQAIVVPEAFITTRFGVDTARLARDGVDPIEVPIQRGRTTPDGVEILSGLRPGDRLVRR